MSKKVDTEYNPIEIGTQEDDNRLTANNIYLIPGPNRQQRVVLNPSQALKLVSVILETLSELPIEVSELRIE